MTDLRLEFSISSGSAEGLPRLIELVGQSLVRLYLEVHDYGVMDEVPSILLACCPNLKTLTVRGRWSIDSASFLGLYRESELSLEELNCSFGNMFALANELADRHTRLAQTLKRLTFIFNPSWDYWEEDELRCMKRMLDWNSTLEYLKLIVPREMYDYSIDDLRRFHNQPLAIQMNPFPLKCRIAFLSIFTASQRLRPKSGAKRSKRESSTSSDGTLREHSVDRHVMSIIFAFAATCVRRQVYLTPQS